MVFFFGGDKKEESKPKGEYIPVDLVRRYASEGLPEQEIVSRLQSHGFTMPQINEALRIAVKQEVGRPTQRRPPSERPPRMGPPPTQAPRRQIPPSERLPIPRRPEPTMPIERVRQDEPRRMPERRQRPMGVPPERIVSPREQRPLMLPSAPTEEAFTFERPPEERFELPEEPEITLEEVIEGIVAEKWDEFEDRLTNFEKRDLQIQGQVEDLRKKLSEIEKLTKDKERTLIGKFEDFGDSMSTIEGRIGSIEKVFKDFLPELTDNIKVMSDLVEKMKKKK